MDVAVLEEPAIKGAPWREALSSDKMILRGGCHRASAVRIEGPFRTPGIPGCVLPV